jgi:hypothetical protein
MLAFVCPTKVLDVAWSCIPLASVMDEFAMDMQEFIVAENGIRPTPETLACSLYEQNCLEDYHRYNSLALQASDLLLASEQGEDLTGV